MLRVAAIPRTVDTGARDCPGGSILCEADAMPVSGATDGAGRIPAELFRDQPARGPGQLACKTVALHRSIGSRDNVLHREVVSWETASGVLSDCMKRMEAGYEQSNARASRFFRLSLAVFS
jgi:hypothetical protein